MKALNLPQLSQEALLNGASMLIVPIKQYDKDGDEYSICIKNYKINGIVEKSKRVYKFNQPIKDFIKTEALYQIGDKISFEYSLSKSVNTAYKSIIKDIKVVRIQELTDEEIYQLIIYWLYNHKIKNGKCCKTLKSDFKDWYNKQYRNYDDNPYVFLYEVEQ